MDISTPSNPTHLGSYQSTTHLDGATDIKIIGNYAYVTAFLAKKLTVIDITNPVTPLYVSSIGTISGAPALDGAYGLVYS